MPLRSDCAKQAQREDWAAASGVGVTAKRFYVGSYPSDRSADHLMNTVILRYTRIITLAAGLLGGFVQIATAQTVTLVVNNLSNQNVTFTPQLTVLTPSGNGTATLTSGTTPITVAASGTNSQVSVSLNPTSGPVSVTLELDGSFANTAFAFIQVFGSPGPGQGIVSYNLNTVRPFNSPSVLAPSDVQTNYTVTLTLPSNPVILPTTKWTTKRTVVQKDGENFFAKGVDYSPTPIGGATFQPGIGDWFTPPWWSYNGVNSPNDIGQRDIAILTGIGVNALRTYYTWYWLKQDDNSYLQNIKQDSPLTVFTNTQYPYTVFFDHNPFLDACYQSGVYVVLGIALEGGNCFNFDAPEISSAYQNFYLQTAVKIATLYGQHPAVIGFCMSNEQNQPPINQDSRVWLYYQKIYEAIKAVAPDKLVTIAFQDDRTLYNGSLRVKDLAGQNPPTIFNNVPIEQAISTVVDVWGLNIYSGMSGDFDDYQTNVINAASGANARPLWLTEWGTPAGENIPVGESGPTSGNAKAGDLSAEELALGAQGIAADISYMHTNLGFVAGAFYFEYSDEWWKNSQFNPKNVNTTISPLNPQTGEYQTNSAGQVTMNDGSLAYPGYPFTHDGGQSTDWPEESWGLYSVAVANNRAPQNPDPNNPDIFTARQPYVTAVSNGYATLAAAYAKESPSPRGDGIRSQLVARRYGHVDTEWGVKYRVPGTQKQWQLDPFGAVEVLKNHGSKGLTVRLLDWDDKEAFLPRRRPKYIRFLSTDQWYYVQEDVNAAPPSEDIPIFQLIPPTDSQFSEAAGPFEEPPIPSAPVP